MNTSSSVDRPISGDKVTISFGEKYAESEQFQNLFREGMSLVEDTAEYLDGEGRGDAKGLVPPASLAYATESMRLTTRLMQLASWLLIRRAVNEGEMTIEQALEEKHKVKLQTVGRASHTKGYEDLPARLKELIDESYRLHDRIVSLDKLMHNEGEVEAPDGPNPFSAQMDQLRAAFEKDQLQTSV